VDRLEGIKIFVRVVESGSFSAVARELGTGQPAISKQVAALEKRLGAQLLRRTSRSLSLTEAGRDFYESAVRLIGDLEVAESRIGSGQAAPSGVVRVTAAHAFSRLHIVPHLPAFRNRYPNVVIEMLVSERTSNLVEEGIDLAIRNGTLADSSLLARKIGESAIIAVASPDYLALKGEPKRPSDIDGHDGVIFVSQDGPRPWTFASRAEQVSYQASASFRSNDGEQLRAAVLAGLGITQAPYWLFAADLRAGTVRRILRDHEPGRIAISVVRPASRRQPSKVAVFIDFLAELLAKAED
jgi:LysR family transcriptional regulator for bpeEF and oprC